MGSRTIDEKRLSVLRRPSPVGQKHPDKDPSHYLQTVRCHGDVRWCENNLLIKQVNLQGLVPDMAGFIRFQFCDNDAIEE